jgi:Calcineurin-like phosphoesterase
MTLKEIVSKIKKVSKETGIEASKITLTQLSQVGISERQIRNNGGLAKIKSVHFPETEKNLKVIRELSLNNSYTKKLENQVGDHLLFQEQILEVLKKSIKSVKVPKAKAIKKSKSKIERDVVVMLTDTHFGLNVDASEVGGINSYNWTVASRRVAFMAKQVAEYKIEKRSEVRKLHVILNGDHLQGLIHGLSDRTQDLLGVQQNGAMHIFTHFIGYVSQFYKQVEVHCNVGNHDENITRREGGRITSHAMKDSFLTPVYYGLSLAFKDCKNITFNLSKGLYLDIQLPAGRAAAFHGHTIFSKQLGSTGTSINVKGLSDAINRWNSGEVELGRKKVTLVIFGHTHVHAEFTTFDGVRVLVSPSLSGIDNYAHSLGINHNQAAQFIFESTKNHIFGDSRMVNVLLADKDNSLDKILPPYKEELTFK